MIIWLSHLHYSKVELLLLELMPCSRFQIHLINHYNKYLQESRDGLDFYAEYLESGKLVTERSQLEKLAQKVGLGFVLPNQLRFKK